MKIKSFEYSTMIIQDISNYYDVEYLIQNIL